MMKKARDLAKVWGAYRGKERLIAVTLTSPSDMLIDRADAIYHRPSPWGDGGKMWDQPMGYMSYHWHTHVPLLAEGEDPTRLTGLLRGKYMKGCLPSGDKEPVAIFNSNDDISLSGGVSLALYRNHFWEVNLTHVAGASFPRTVRRSSLWPPLDSDPDPLFQPFAEAVSSVTYCDKRVLTFEDMIPVFTEVEKVAKHHGDLGLEMYLRMVSQRMLRGESIQRTYIKEELSSLAWTGFRFYGDFKVVAVLFLQ